MKSLLLAVCLLAFAAPAAQAGGVNLTWGTGCWRDSPATLQGSACDSSDGTISFTVSFAPERAIRNFTAIQTWVDLQSDTADLPDWWQLTDPGGCRQGSLSTSADITATPGGCADPWQGQPIVSRHVSWRTAAFPAFTNLAANRAQLYVDYWILPPGVTLARGVEYYGYTVTINFAKTVGAGACGGCGTPATIVLNTVTLRGSPTITLTNALDNQCLRWQAGGVTPCSATSVRSSTWGQLKGLYR